MKFASAEQKIFLRRMKNHLAEIEKSISAKRFYDLLTFVREPLASRFL